MKTPVEDLIGRWREEAKRFSDLGLREAGAITEQHAVELAEARFAEARVHLSLSQAAEYGGYSKGHLRRLVRDGELINRGGRGSPAFHVEDVPVKPGHVPPSLEAIHAQTPMEERATVQGSRPSSIRRRVRRVMERRPGD